MMPALARDDVLAVCAVGIVGCLLALAHTPARGLGALVAAAIGFRIGRALLRR